VNSRELTAELQRLRQMARSLLGAIEALQTRAEIVDSNKTVPPPARPTTRLRRPTKSMTNVPIVNTNIQEDEPPSTRPGAGGGTYRHVSPKKR
jgi:hypothetical protein